MSNETTTTRRKNILTNWTGGTTIEPKYREDRDKDGRAKAYVKRLYDTLEGGLWMTWQTIEPFEPWDKYKRPATCFAEIEPSDALEHAKKFGYLGFGFTREFIMKRYGGPVHYVPGTKEMEEEIGAHNNIPEHVEKLSKLLAFLGKQTAGEVKTISLKTEYENKGNCHFNRFIKECDLSAELEKYDDRPDFLVFHILSASVMNLGIFVKKMSDPDSKHAFELLDEAEWRLPYNDNARENGYISPLDKDGCPPSKIRFSPSDLKRLVVPDNETYEEVLQHQGIRALFGDLCPETIILDPYTEITEWP